MLEVWLIIGTALLLATGCWIVADAGEPSTRRPRREPPGASHRRRAQRLQIRGW